MVCYDLNDFFTAELAKNAENKRIFVMPLRILPLRAPAGSQALWLPARRAYSSERPEAAISSVAGGERVSKQ